MVTQHSDLPKTRLQKTFAPIFNNYPSWACEPLVQETMSQKVEDLEREHGREERKSYFMRFACKVDRSENMVE